MCNRRGGSRVPLSVMVTAVALTGLWYWERDRRLGIPRPTSVPKTPRPDEVGVCQPSTSHNFPLARFTTTKGQFTVELRADLAPKSVARLKAWIKEGYFNGPGGIAFFRVNQWITQFGPDEYGLRPQFKELRRFDEKDRDANPCHRQPWALGTLALIGGNQMVLVLTPNDAMGTNTLDAPAGYVVEGMAVLHSLYKYNDPIDNPNGGPGPEQGKLQAPGGQKYLKDHFPDLDYITNAVLL